MSRHSEDGRRYRTMRKAYLAANQVCWICHHVGADQIDHDPPRAQHRANLDQRTWRPAHGTNRCPTCGRRCNQERGTKALVDLPEPFVPAIKW